MAVLFLPCLRSPIVLPSVTRICFGSGVRQVRSNTKNTALLKTNKMFINVRNMFFKMHSLFFLYDNLKTRVHLEPVWPLSGSTVSLGTSRIF